MILPRTGIDGRSAGENRLPFEWKAAWAAYLLLLWDLVLRIQNPQLMADDSGEMAAAAASLGLPHPPGYPLFNLLGRLAVLVPLGTPAFRLNLLSLAFALLSLAALARLGRRVIPWRVPVLWREGLLALAAFFLLTSRPVLSQSLTAKGLVYTFTLWLSLVVADAALRDRERSVKILAFTAFLWGCGMAGHWPTVLLWAPALAWTAWSLRGSLTRKAWALGAAVCGVGLSLYLYLPLRAALHPRVCWGDPTDLGGFLWVILRKLTAGTEPLLRDPARYLEAIRETGRILFLHSFQILPVFGAVTALVLVFKRNRIALWMALMVVPVLAGIVIVPRPSSFYLLDVYLLCTLGALALSSAAGLAFLFRRPQPRLRWLGMALLLAHFCVWAFGNVLRREDQSRAHDAGDLGINILQALPRDAFFLAEGDLSVFPLWYYQAAEGKRLDVAMVPTMFFYHPWGWDQAVRMRPALSGAGGQGEGPVEQWGAIRESLKNRLFVSIDRSHLETFWNPGTDAYRPNGLVYGIPPSLTHLDPEEVRNRYLAVQTQRRFRILEAGAVDDLMRRQILRYYADDWAAFGGWLARHGRYWEGLGWIARAMRIDQNVPAYYSNAAWMLGRMGYPEAAVDLCLWGLAVEPGRKTLETNLEMARAESRKEPSRIKKRKYRALAQQALDSELFYLADSFDETADRLERER